MKIIEVTDHYNEGKLTIMVNKIIALSDFKGFTNIVYGGNEDAYFSVKETSEEIINLIQLSVDL